MENPQNSQKKRPFGLRTVMELFDVGPGVAISVLAVCMSVVLVAVAYFVYSAPPSQIVISTGPEGSSSERQALAYAKILERSGVKLKILRSNGSFENLQRLMEPSSHVDVGFVQGGIAKEPPENLVSLGNISYQPLLVFYRGKPLDYLSGLAGKKIAIGKAGSGVRVVALALLAANGIKEGDKTSTLLDLGPEEAAKDLMDRKIDAAFLMGESTPMPVLRSLVHSSEVQLFSFSKQASAYSRKIDYLNVLDLPQGSIDLGQNIPSHDVTLVGPMVELVADKKLHPALSDLLLEAMVETHGKPGMFQKRGEFPNPQEHTIHISEDASRYYKSGKSLFYRYLPFWFASILSRFLFAIVPTLVVLIPVMRSIPAMVRWRVSLRIRRHYRELLELEKSYLLERDPAKQAELRREFDRIEEKVNKARIRPAYADQFYGLRGHINYVRDLVARGVE
jgi:TRAP-type uncharacterized transport system substrate-binding protein